MVDCSQPLWTRFVAIGDSLSEGLGDPLTGGATRGWANLLAARLRLGDPRVEFLNLAVRGHLARDAVRRQLEAALAFEPDLVSIFIGGNDVLLGRTFDADTFERELSQLVEPFDRRGATIVLSTLPDLTACSPLLPPLRGLLRQRILAANAVITRVSCHHSTVLLDAWADPRTRRHAMWSIDRIHPSASGHRMIAESVARLLGVPIADGAVPAVGIPVVGTVRRHAREVAWLVRYANRRIPSGVACEGMPPRASG